MDEYVAPPARGEFGWNFIPKSERICRECKQPIKKLTDVGQTGTLYPSNHRYLVCSTCLYARGSETREAHQRS